MAPDGLLATVFDHLERQSTMGRVSVGHGDE
jgi:hypothetical protein